MARKTVYGKVILSAGEISGYVVCPESWRLKAVQRVKSQSSPAEATGRDLHESWAQSFDQISYLTRSAKIAVALIFLALAVFALFH